MGRVKSGVAQFRLPHSSMQPLTQEEEDNVRVLLKKVRFLLGGNYEGYADVYLHFQRRKVRVDVNEGDVERVRRILEEAGVRPQDVVVEELSVLEMPIVGIERAAPTQPHSCCILS